MSATAAVESTVHELCSLDVDSLDLAGIAAANRSLARVQAWLDTLAVRLATRTEALHLEGRCAPAGEVLGGSGGRTRAEGRRIQRRSHLLGQVPALAEALDHGSISAAHVDAVANVAERLDDDTRTALFVHGDLLAATAAAQSPEKFARWCRRLVDRIERDAGIERFERQRRATHLRRWVDSSTGMYVLHGEFDPETGARIFTALDAELDARWHAEHPGDEVVPTLGRSNPHLAAHALAALVTGGYRASRPGVAEIVVLIDLDTLIHGRHDHSVCELHDGTDIPVSLARRLACDAEVLPVVLAGTGEVLDLGRRQLLANRAQRRALRAMYRTCAWAGCTVPFHHCQIHHLTDWHRGGPTDLSNLLPLCDQHHHLAHEGRWRLHLAPDRTLTIHRPDGTHHAIVPLERVADRRCHPRVPDHAGLAGVSPGSAPP